MRRGANRAALASPHAPSRDSAAPRPRDAPGGRSRDGWGGLPDVGEGVGRPRGRAAAALGWSGRRYVSRSRPAPPGRGDHARRGPRPTVVHGFSAAGEAASRLSRDSSVTVRAPVLRDEVARRSGRCGPPPVAAPRAASTVITNAHRGRAPAPGPRARSAPPPSVAPGRGAAARGDRGPYRRGRLALVFCGWGTRVSALPRFVGRRVGLGWFPRSGQSSRRRTSSHRDPSGQRASAPFIPVQGLTGRRGRPARRTWWQARPVVRSWSIARAGAGEGAEGEPGLPRAGQPPIPGCRGRREGSPGRPPFLSVPCPRLRAVAEIRRPHTCAQPRSGEIQATFTLCMAWVQLPLNLGMQLWTTRPACGQSVDEEDSSTVRDIHPLIHPQVVHTPSHRASRDNGGYPHNPQPLLRALHFSLGEKKKEKQGVGTSRSGTASESSGRAAPPSGPGSQALRWCPAPRPPAARAPSAGLAPSASSIRPDCRLPWWTAIPGAPVMIATARKDAR